MNSLWIEELSLGETQSNMIANHKPDPGRLKLFQLSAIFAVALLIVQAGGLRSALHFKSPAYLISAILILVSPAFFPSSWKRIFRAWLGLGHFLGMINSTLLLGIIFYLVLTPVGLVRSWFSAASAFRTNKNSLSSKVKFGKVNWQLRMKEPF